MSNRQYRGFVNGDVALLISRPGIDVTAAPSDQDLDFDSRWLGAWPVHSQRYVTLSNGNASIGFWQWAYYDDLGYTPFVDCYLPTAGATGWDYNSMHAYYPYATRESYVCVAFRDRVYCAAFASMSFKVTIWRCKAFDP
jgi:hypothetical protein